MPRRTRLLAPVALFVALASSRLPAGATPPQPPLDLRLVLLEAPAPDRVTPFAIEVVPLVQAERVRVRIVAPRGVALASPGDTLLLAGDVAPGQARRWTSAVRVSPGRRHDVRVRVEITTPAGITWSRGDHLVLLVGPLLVPDPVARPGTDGHGGAVLEYDGQATARTR